MRKILSIYAIFFSLFIIFNIISVLMSASTEISVQTWQGILVIILSLPIIVLGAFVLKE